MVLKGSKIEENKRNKGNCGQKVIKEGDNTTVKEQMVLKDSKSKEKKGPKLCELYLLCK